MATSTSFPLIAPCAKEDRHSRDRTPLPLHLLLQDPLLSPLHLVISTSIVFWMAVPFRNGKMLLTLLPSSKYVPAGCVETKFVMPYSSSIVPVGLGVKVFPTRSFCMLYPFRSRFEDDFPAVLSKYRKMGRIGGMQAAIIAMFCSRLFACVRGGLRYLDGSGALTLPRSRSARRCLKDSVYAFSCPGLVGCTYTSNPYWR